jgi:glyoxylase I family protein
MKALGLDWVGTRTAHFQKTVAFFGETLGLPIGIERDDFVRLDLPDSSSVEVFGPGDTDHRYFTTGPVVGFWVEDLDRACHDLSRHRVELLGPRGGEKGQVRWQHFRSPDGYVYEVVEDPLRHPRRPPVGPLALTHLAWVGTRTARYDETRAFFQNVLGLPMADDFPELTEFRLPDGGAIEVFLAGSSLDHPHFSTGPVPGFGVADLDRAIAYLRSRKVPVLQAQPSAEGGWAHFRAPDGNVYEIKGLPSH